MELNETNILDILSKMINKVPAYQFEKVIGIVMHSKQIKQYINITGVYENPTFLGFKIINILDITTNPKYVDSMENKIVITYLNQIEIAKQNIIIIDYFNNLKLLEE